MINNLPVRETPAYLFDVDGLRERVKMIRRQLGEKIRLVYAMKANPFIISAILPYVDGLEVCSPGEERICRHAGVPGSSLILSGVYKEEENFSEIMDVYGEAPVYTAESETQARLLDRLAREKGLRVKVLLRLTAGSQFGMDETVLRRLAADSESLSGIRIVGVHFFSGTQKKEKRTAREIERVDELLMDLKPEPEELEFGPGLAVSYFESDEPRNEEEILSDLRARLENMRFGGRITLEMGRFIAAPCGTYLTKVVDKKENEGQHFCIVDGGIHQVNYYGQNMAMKIPPIQVFRDGRVLPKAGIGDGQEPVSQTICGSLCTTADVLLREWNATNLAVGDVLAFGMAGAYAMTEGPALFLSRELPAVYLRENGTLRRIRNKYQTEVLNDGTID